MSPLEPVVREMVRVRTGEKEAGEGGVGADGPDRGYPQGARVRRCTASQSGHGWQRKGELWGHWLTTQSMNQPGLQPQWVSATAEQFFRATWEAGRGDGGEQRLSEPKSPTERQDTSPGEWR